MRHPLFWIILIAIYGYHVYGYRIEQNVFDIIILSLGRDSTDILGLRELITANVSHAGRHLMSSSQDIIRHRL